jgi:hypothetical protein
VAEPPFPSGGEAAPQLASRGEQHVARLRQRLSPQRPHLVSLHLGGRRHVREHGVEVVLALREEGVEEARRAGIVQPALAAALEQPPVLEEDMH